MIGVHTGGDCLVDRALAVVGGPMDWGVSHLGVGAPRLLGDLPKNSGDTEAGGVTRRPPKARATDRKSGGSGWGGYDSIALQECLSLLF